MGRSVDPSTYWVYARTCTPSSASDAVRESSSINGPGDLKHSLTNFPLLAEEFRGASQRASICDGFGFWQQRLATVGDRSKRPCFPPQEFQRCFTMGIGPVAKLGPPPSCIRPPKSPPAGGRVFPELYTQSDGICATSSSFHSK